ncbi:MAG: hypothetical protein GY943_22890 [Chloroflexi bacterium]|nr:hypothetical protein [Chloroflexota bacterium]
MKATVQLGSKQYIIIGLAVATALIHLILGIMFGADGILFILNGIGYLALIVGFYFVPQLAGQRGLVRWALLGYTAVTVILYFVLTPELLSPIGIVDKLIELGLIGLLWQEKA